MIKDTDLNLQTDLYLQTAMYGEGMYGVIW